ncbi:MAG: LacI family DNA-binding transcriptional regulator [Gemmatimonadaceae bacterium]|nr:LacI family DNA-binding transcriptional regulator [Chitinophagaceae bacterium]
METVNLKMLARVLNLSISTVSKALRDSYDISVETKERVLAVAKELNYQPNLYASSLRKHKSKTIAVVIPEIANPYFGLVINGIESIAQEKGYHVTIYLSHEDYQKELQFTRHLLSGRVDGALISVASSTIDYAHFHELIEKDLPLVFFDRICEECKSFMVTTDDQESSYTATKHLIARGCKKIAHLAISGNLSIGKKRLAGYRQAIEEAGLANEQDLILECSNDTDADRIKIRDLFIHHKPDGIFAAVERYAITSYEICRELNLRIPEDVRVIGFSNLESASLLKPSLSTITQPAYEIGKQAALILFSTIEKKGYGSKHEHVVIPSKLIPRASTEKFTDTIS